MKNKKIFAVYETDPLRRRLAYLISSPYEFSETVEMLGSFLEAGLQYFVQYNDLDPDLKRHLHYLTPTELFYWTARYLQDRKPDLGIEILELDGDMSPALPIGYFLSGWHRFPEEPFVEWVVYDELRKFLRRMGLLEPEEEQVDVP